MYIYGYIKSYAILSYQPSSLMAKAEKTKNKQKANPNLFKKISLK